MPEAPESYQDHNPDKPSKAAQLAAELAAMTPSPEASLPTDAAFAIGDAAVVRRSNGEIQAGWTVKEVRPDGTRIVTTPNPDNPGEILEKTATVEGLTWAAAQLAAPAETAPVGPEQAPYRQLTPALVGELRTAISPLDDLSRRQGIDRHDGQLVADWAHAGLGALREALHQRPEMTAQLAGYRQPLEAIDHQATTIDLQTHGQLNHPPLMEGSSPAAVDKSLAAIQASITDRRTKSDDLGMASWRHAMTGAALDALDQLAAGQDVQFSPALQEELAKLLNQNERRR